MGDWNYGSFGLNTGLIRYGLVIGRGGLADGSQDQKFAARWQLILSACFVWSRWAFVVGADNLTNPYPTEASLNNVYEGRGDGLQHSALSPFGFNGRYGCARQRPVLPLSEVHAGAASTSCPRCIKCEVG